MMRARVYRDDAGEWRWTLSADNGEPLAVSSEGYVERSDAVHALGLTANAGGSIEMDDDEG